MINFIKTFFPANFNDLLCLFVLTFIFGIWIMDGFKIITMNAEVLGATIAFFTLVSQYYYRKKVGEGK